VGRLPPRLAGWLGRRLGDIAFLLLGSRRRVALENLERAFPGQTPHERRRLCRRSFQHLGLSAMELCRALVRPVETLLPEFSVEGLDNLKSVMEGDGRALVVSAHLGNWELLGLAHALSGYRLAVVARRLDSPALEDLASRLRTKTGVELIDKRQALRPVLTALRRGRFVGILLDQNASRREGVFVPFFGIPASTSRSIAVLSLRTQTPIVPIFIRRAPGGGHQVVVKPALQASSPNGGEDAVVELTMLCTQAIEDAIREAPEQWLWVHRRWRTRPDLAEALS
jgi:Kdo2-lipid IVA lauroyltransferase/acyltransferase